MGRLWLGLIAALAGACAFNIAVSHARVANALVGFRESDREREGWNPETVQSLATGAFWEIRRSAAFLTWSEAQTYFHNGFDLAAFGRNKEREKEYARHAAESHEEEHHDEAEPHLHSEEEELRIHSLSNHPFLKRSPLRPYIFEHVEGGDGAARMMPFYWLTTQLDPNFVRAYTNGAYWLAFSFKNPSQALKYLDRGIRYNPNDYSLYAMRGHIHFSILKDEPKAVTEFEKAVALNPLKTDDEREDGVDTLRLLGRTYMQLKDYDNAIRVGYAINAIKPGAFGADGLISEATTILEWHPQ